MGLEKGQKLSQAVCLSADDSVSSHTSSMSSESLMPDLTSVAMSFVPYKWTILNIVLLMAIEPFTYISAVAKAIGVQIVQSLCVCYAIQTGLRVTLLITRAILHRILTRALGPQSRQVIAFNNFWDKWLDPLVRPDDDDLAMEFLTHNSHPIFIMLSFIKSINTVRSSKADLTCRDLWPTVPRILMQLLLFAVTAWLSWFKLIWPRMPCLRRFVVDYRRRLALPTAHALLTRARAIPHDLPIVLSSVEQQDMQEADAISAANDERDCGICCELLSSQTRCMLQPCAHVFHKECVEQLLTNFVAHQLRTSCPCCRQDIANIVAVPVA